MRTKSAKTIVEGRDQERDERFLAFARLRTNYIESPDGAWYTLMYEISAKFGCLTRTAILEASTTREAEEIFRSIPGVPKGVEILGIRCISRGVIWTS